MNRGSASAIPGPANDPETFMRSLVFAAALLALGTTGAIADPIHDNIAAALRAYDTGDMRTAKQRLDMASQQIAQRNAQLLSTVLPQPYRGWTADKPEIVGIGNLFGGMVTVKRVYRSPDGKSVTLSIIGDSPMLAAFLAMVSNPQIALMSGAKIETIAGQQAMVTQNGEIQMAFGNRWFFTVEGSAPMGHKRGYLQAVNYRALQQLR